jgi:hypothetical protein
LPNATDTFLDQVAWGAPGSGTIFYSVRYAGGDNLIYESERETFAAALGIEPEYVNVSFWVIVLHRVDLATGEDIEYYHGNGYAIGRMIATPDGQGLLMTIIPNMVEWVFGILNGDFDPTSEDGRAIGLDMVQTQLTYVNLEENIRVALTIDFNMAALDAAHYAPPY